MKKFIKEYIAMAAGIFFIAVSVENFLLPSRISSGGVSAIGTVLFHMFNVPLSVTNIIFNIILFALGYKFLEKDAVFKTVFGVVVLTLFLEVATLFPSYTEDVFCGTVAGGVFLGIGLGLVVRFGGSTGGSDFAGIIIKKILPHISVPAIIFLIDFTIIVISGVIFKSFTVIIYSAISVFISAMISDYVIYIGNSAKQITVNSEKSKEIAQEIMHRFSRGATGIYCKGMYSDREQLVIMCVVSPKQLPKVMDLVKKIDKKAFVVVTDVKEVMGKGF